jgi:hypothetical protein
MSVTRGEDCALERGKLDGHHGGPERRLPIIRHARLGPGTAREGQMFQLIRMAAFATRDQLAGEFTSGDKSHCLGLSSLRGVPTYTELLTCLELARDARNLRDTNKRRTTGQGARERSTDGPPY